MKVLVIGFLRLGVGMGIPISGVACLAQAGTACPLSFGQKVRFLKVKINCGERLWNKPKPNRGLIAIQGLFHTTCGLQVAMSHEILNLAKGLNRVARLEVICPESLSIDNFW